MSKIFDSLICVFDGALCCITLGSSAAAFALTTSCFLVDMGIHFGVSKAELECADRIALSCFITGTCLAVIENALIDISDIEYEVQKEARHRQIEAEMHILNMQRESRPISCGTCIDYCGEHNVVCGIHPYGWNIDSQCPDRREG